MGTAILEITDGTTTVNLMSKRSGFHLNEWIPKITEPKEGGVWSDLATVDGRNMSARAMQNVTEELDLKAVDIGGDDQLIIQSRALRALLEKAVQFWITDWQNTPVYIKAKSSYETNIRYSIIKDYRTPQDSNPYGGTFRSKIPEQAIDSFLLTIERDPFWISTPPGTPECLMANALFSATIPTGTPTASSNSLIPVNDNHDAYISVYGLTIDLTTEPIKLGVVTAGSERYECGFVFGLTIASTGICTSCLLTIEANAGSGATACEVTIYGIDAKAPGAFTTFAAFNALARTSRSVNWSIPQLAAPGSTATSPELKDIVNELINKHAGTTNVGFLLVNNFSPDSTLRELKDFTSGAGNAPTLATSWEERNFSTLDRGQENTCNDGEIRIINNGSEAQITDIYYEDNPGVFSSNLVNAALPTNLFPNPQALNDCLYIGAATATNDLTRRFTNVVLNIATAAAGDWITTLEFWRTTFGGAWVTISGWDSEGVYTSGGFFQRTGLRSCHWNLPDNWGATTVNSINAFWVRFRISTFTSSSATVPTQGTRPIYNARAPYIDIDSSKILGDVNALIQLLAVPVSGKYWTPLATSELTGADELILGARSLSRGSLFSAYIDMTGVQTQLVDVSFIGATFTTDDISVTGYARIVQGTGGAYPMTKSIGSIHFGRTEIDHYKGRFRMYARFRLMTGAVADFAFYATISTGRADFPIITTTQTVYLNRTGAGSSTPDFDIVDFGDILLPPLGLISATDDFLDTYINFYATCANGTSIARLYDIILIPIDEWAGRFYIDLPTSGSSKVYQNYYDSHFLLESTFPKRTKRAFTVTGRTSGGYIQNILSNESNGAITLNAASDQRIWILAGNINGLTLATATPRRYPLNISLSPKLNASFRYLSMRGNS